MRTIEFDNGNLIFLDQTKLPLEENYIATNDYERIALAIERLEIRGAPAIGVAAAYAIAVGLLSDQTESNFEKINRRLAMTRPTAVNLFWALDEMKKVYYANKNSKILLPLLFEKANEILQDDIKKCEAIAVNGNKIFYKKSNVLTHCNTGSLATAGNGTALNVIKKGFENGFVQHVFVDETRPLMQGSRLTAFELDKHGIPFTIITDSTAAFLMKQDKIDLVIVGADRIALNGDTANKIGTYNLAVLSNYHKLPFYVAAPTSSIDKNCSNGDEIKIELRDKAEITHIKNVQITKDNYNVYSPAFDVTPNNLITAIITEKDFHLPPYYFKNV
ncbi:S-methyl-5-thioribose-1-phosphate isomerase [Melioribacteraceae bacterium 4301-Me]|uniref:S-methyl-5-thioribose-1-phosphate isomerase n=1 Tax=Pyranulibacter aquaticus TaxID=3163344 RepID=UPI00359AD1B1